MKSLLRWLPLCLACLLLAGCAGISFPTLPPVTVPTDAPASTGKTEPPTEETEPPTEETEPPTEETEPPTKETEPPTEETEPPTEETEPPTEETEPPTEETHPPYDESAPQVGEPIVPQPGDTSLTWNPEAAYAFPADSECTPELLLQKWSEVEGITAADAADRGCRQLVLVVAEQVGSEYMTAWCYEQNEDGNWQVVDSLAGMDGYVAKYGIRHDRKINSYTTPAGFWALGTAFGNADEPDGLKMPWRQVTENSYWVGDVYSSRYNTWQELDSPDWVPFDLYESEHLADWPEEYAYACVIQYNTPPYTLADRGFAIFFHCATGYTAGCVGLPEWDFLRVLDWLDAEKNPCILITGAADS